MTEKTADLTTPELPYYEAVLADVVTLLENARRAAARSVNAFMTAAYWEIGRRMGVNKVYDKRLQNSLPTPFQGRRLPPGPQFWGSQREKKGLPESYSLRIGGWGDSLINFAYTRGGSSRRKRAAKPAPSTALDCLPNFPLT